MRPFAKAGMAGLIALGMLPAAAPVAGAASLAGPAPVVRQDPHGARICSPLVAMRKARGMGLRNAEIAAITARRVVVTGHGRHGRTDRVVFGNEPGCPMLPR